MKIQHLLTLWLSLISILFGGTNASAQFTGGSATNLPLVASTDFSVIGGENVNYHSIDMLNNFGGLIQPTFKVNFSLPDSTTSTVKESAFLYGQHYAITSNPSKLDSLRFIDNKDSGEWGLIISNGDGVAPKDPVFSMEVNGLKNNGNYRVVVEICNPHSESYLDISGTNKGPHLRGGYNATIKIAANNSLYGGRDARPGMTAGSCAEIAITNPATATSEFGPVQNNRLTINFYGSQMKNGEAIMIKSIKVYGEIDSKIIGEHSACVGGKTARFKLKNAYDNCTYQWYKDGIAISGATGTSYTHTTGNVEGKEYKYYCEITTSAGDKIKSDEFKFTDRLCCTDGNGNALDEKLIWQDDFGTFTKKGSYWVWDYTDINNPVKTYRTTKNGWTYGLSAEEEKQLSATYPEDGIHFEEGTYTVAANVTSIWDGANDGTMWEWQSYTFNGKTPGENGFDFAPDHTYNGDAYGAMLFLNVNSEPDSAIYSRVIENLCEKSVTVKCYINNWSAAPEPVAIKIRVTDINSGNSNVSDVVTRDATNDGIEWKEVSVSIELTGDNPSLKFEIISAIGGKRVNMMGNDLLLDDIQVWTCTPPSVKLYFDEENTIESSTSCSGDDIQLYAEETTMIKTYYKNNAGYIYQYTFDDPSDKKSWKPIPGSEITNKLTYDDLADLFDGKNSGEKIYFRVVLGSEMTLNELGLDYAYNPDEICAAYSVSEPIVCNIKCHKCTAPDAEFRKPTAEFCEGEGKGMVDMKLTDGDMSDYTIRWWGEADSLATPLGDDLSANFFESLKATEGGIYSYQLVDKQTGCVGEVHNFEVIVNPIPKKPSDENILYELTGEREILTTDKFNQTIDSTLRLLWYTNVDPAIESNSKGVKAVEVYLNNPNEENSLVYYIAYRSEEGCFSERAKVDVTVSPITSVESISADENEIVNVYTVSGALIKANVKRSEALNGLANGTYVIGNQKVIVK